MSLGPSSPLRTVRIHGQIETFSDAEGECVGALNTGHGSIDIVGINGTGKLAWWENPRDGGGFARSGVWNEHEIGPAHLGVSVVAGKFSSYVNDVIVGSNEVLNNTVYGGGLVRFSPTNGVFNTWHATTINSTYRYVHQINAFDVNHDGKLDAVAGEQEQSSKKRLAVFYGDGSGGFTQTVLWTGGTHNQVVVNITRNNTAIMGSNHHHYGVADPVLAFVERPHY
jgi:hypothetical protein